MKFCKTKEGFYFELDTAVTIFIVSVVLMIAMPQTTDSINSLITNIGQLKLFN